MELAGTFIFIAIFLFFAIKPTALAISSLVGEIKSKEIANQKMKGRINNIIQAQESFSQAQEKYSILESGFPSDPNFYQIAVNFSTLAKNYSLKINQLDFDLPDNNDQQKNNTSKIKSFKIIFSSTGDYQSVVSFIKELLNNRRLVNISSIKISQPKDKDTLTGSNIINISLDAEIPYAPIEDNEKN
ncbi:hypothetical protein SDC9_108483 [bioreactor metagenome]|uniref:Uncharacterized protein n=1 Tax=bioreactor metagenome TaxID=1076179 RepID=A0A645BEL2_9ZZZZ